MKVKELIEKLNTMPREISIVLCNLNYDSDGVVPMPDIHSVEFIPSDKEVGPVENCVFINFEQ